MSQETLPADADLKRLTARSVKWNAIDRLGTQVLYAVTGIVLARVLSPDDFGLVGAVLIFQAFAAIVIDSGFSSALLQRKEPTRLDYSSVLWFNMGVAVAAYAILYLAAPLIAMCFQDDERLVGMSRVMFLTIILNASAIVQVNRLVKRMHVMPVAVADMVSLTVGGAVAIVMAVKGVGAWAIICQSLVNSGVKSLILWCWSRWLPLLRFSWAALRSYLGVGGSMMLTSLLNTLFQNIYSFFIGNRTGLGALGYYTQADKWSKMGVMSISQTLTSSFLPPLSAAQDDAPRFRRICSKMNRMTAYITLPALVGLMVMATPIFHLLFGEKWDASIPLFVMLLVRGVFTVLTGLYNNYIVALGRTRQIMTMELVRDGTALVALLATLPVLGLGSEEHPVLGIEIMVGGQILASVVAWVWTLRVTCRLSGASPSSYLRDILPYLLITAPIAALLWAVNALALSPLSTLAIQAAAGVALYLGANRLLGSRIQADILAYIFRRKSVDSFHTGVKKLEN